MWHNIDNDDRKRAGLLTFAGDAVQQIYATIEANQPTDDTSKEVKDETNASFNPRRYEQMAKLDTYNDVCSKLTKHFNPQRNKLFERNIFRNTRQFADENIISFATRLRTAARHCQFHNLDEEILDTLLMNCRSENLTKRALSIEDSSKLTLNNIIQMAMKEEQAILQTKLIREPSLDQQGAVNSISEERKSRNQPARIIKNCKYCGGEHVANISACPAKSHICKKCSILGHFDHSCRKRVDLIDQNCNSISQHFNEYSFSVGNINGFSSPRVSLVFQQTLVEFIIDTGSTLTIISKDTFERFKIKPTLTKGISNAYGFGSNKPLNFKGRFNVNVTHNGFSIILEVHVLNYSMPTPNILSYKAASSLNLIHIPSSISFSGQKDQLSYKEKFPELFSGKIGCLKNFELELYEDKSVKPSKLFHYRIPFLVQPQVTRLLNDFVSQGLIEPAVGPTTWISPSHIVPKKDGSVRLVTDARRPNLAIIRNRHVTPTIDDFVAKMNGASVFSKIDLKDAYKQIKLSPKSTHLTVFSTHLGLFRDLRLSQGINAAAEEFQRIIGDLISDLKGCINMMDDIIVYANNKEEHERCLLALLERLESNGLTAGLEKCKFEMDSVDFFGVNFSAKGISPQKSRVEAFQAASSPVSVGEVRSLIAVANYSSRFIPDFAKIIAPLRELTKTNSTKSFEWLPEHDKIVTTLKNAFTTNSLAYFNSSWDSEVICDASNVGLGAILVQSNPEDASDRRIISFASRTLTILEKKYAQVELEALALVFAVEKFHQYIYGKKFKLFTDARSITYIYGTTANQKSSARIERWGLRLLPYEFDLIHIPGENNPADYISRHPIHNDETSECQDADLYVNFIIHNSMPKAITREKVAKATREDRDMQTLIRAIKSSDRHLVANHPSLKEFNNSFPFLTVSPDGIVLRKHQIVIPNALRTSIIDIAHEAHLGIVKTKNLMRLKVWFPNLDRMVEDKIKKCIPCQACTPSNSSNMVPMSSPPVPTRVWHSVGIDFFGPLPSGHYLFSMVCKTSGFPVVEVLNKTTAKDVISVCDRIFSEYGIPHVLCSDNGPPFQSREFRQFCNIMGVHHERSTPYWPRGNSQCERFMKSLSKMVKIAQLEQKPWIQFMQTFLRAYRAAPHSSTGFAPNILMFGRNCTSRLPSMSADIMPSFNTLVNRTDDYWDGNDHSLARLLKAVHNSELAHDKNRAYANRKLNTKPSDLKVGDTVLVKQPVINKLTSQFNSEKLKVIARNGSWVVGESSLGKTITRNISFFKKLSIEPAPDHQTPNSPQSSNNTLDQPSVDETSTNSASLSDSTNYDSESELPLMSSTSESDNTIEFVSPGSKDSTHRHFEFENAEGGPIELSSLNNHNSRVSNKRSKHSEKKETSSRKKLHRQSKKTPSGGYRESRPYNRKSVETHVE